MSKKNLRQLFFLSIHLLIGLSFFHTPKNLYAQLAPLQCGINLSSGYTTYCGITAGRGTVNYAGCQGIDVCHMGDAYRGCSAVDASRCDLNQVDVHSCSETQSANFPWQESVCAAQQGCFIQSSQLPPGYGVCLPAKQPTVYDCNNHPPYTCLGYQVCFADLATAGVGSYQDCGCYFASGGRNYCLFLDEIQHQGAIATPTPTPDPNTTVPGMTPIHFADVDPLQLGGSDNPFEETRASLVDLSSPGKILSRVLQFALPLAGLILFAMIVWGGFEMVLGSADTKSQEAGKQRITAAVLGFVLLFASYWIARLIEIVFNIQFLL